jgi:anti-anti-sigma regulatory factor
MEVKTDTKEKFHVITVETDELTANMTEELCRRLHGYLDDPVKNLVVKVKGIKKIDEEGAEMLTRTQQLFYEKGNSFVICEMEPELEEYLDEKDLLALLNVTPTESEAWDIVQMEEIERELLGDDEEMIQE